MDAAALVRFVEEQFPQALAHGDRALVVGPEGVTMALSPGAHGELSPAEGGSAMSMMRWLALTWLLAACVDGDADPKQPTADTVVVVDTDPPGGVGDSDAQGSEVGDDEAALRGLLEGSGDPEAILAQVAWSGGLPAATADGTFLFVALGEGPWGLAGDFNGWEAEPMLQRGELWSIELAIEEPVGAGYKLVRMTDELLLPDPHGRFHRYDDFGRLSLVRPAPGPHLEWWPGLEGVDLLPRHVEVWVPGGTGPWPLLVAQDGNNLFDPNGVWGGWQLDATLATLDAPVLVVGLHNTAERMSDYTHVDDSIGGLAVTARGDAYADLVTATVLPWAATTWALDGRTGLLGSSLGGLVSLHIGRRDPAAWDFVAAMSPTLGWGRFEAANTTMEQLYVDGGPLDLVVYLDSGGTPGPDGCTDPNGDGSTADDPDATDNYCTTRAMADALAESGWSWDADLWHWWEEGAPHNEAAWAGRVVRPLEQFLAVAP